jgi:hypothetical protein
MSLDYRREIGEPRLLQSNNDVSETLDYKWSEGGVYRGIYNTDSRPTFIDNRYTLGYNLSNFHKRLKRGELLPYTNFRQFRCFGSGDGAYDVDYVSGGYTNRHWCDNHVMDAFVLEEEDLAAYVPSTNTIKYLQEAAAKLYSNSGHDTLTFLAELTSVREMFFNLGKRLLSLRIPKDFLKGFSMTNDWMEYRYGWRTLLFDLYDLQEQVANMNAKRTRYSERSGNSYTTTVVTSDDYPNAFNTRNVRIEDVITVGIRGSITADVELPSFQFNPLQTGWELIPYSFVVDWFLSIGKMLAAWSLLNAHCGSYAAAHGYSVQVVRTFNCSVTSWNSGYSGTDEASGTCTAVLQRRIPAPIPQLPHFTIKLDLAKIYDLLAMIVQRVR